MAVAEDKNRTLGSSSLVSELRVVRVVRVERHHTVTAHIAPTQHLDETNQGAGQVARNFRDWGWLGGGWANARPSSLSSSMWREAGRSNWAMAAWLHPRAKLQSLSLKMDAWVMGCAATMSWANCMI